MSFSSCNVSVGSAIDSVTRWDIYHRLQELDISCQCQCGQPLEIDFKTPLDLLQFRSVAYRMTASRQDCLTMLEHCWTLSI